MAEGTKDGGRWTMDRRRWTTDGNDLQPFSHEERTQCTGRPGRSPEVRRAGMYKPGCEPHKR